MAKKVIDTYKGSINEYVDWVTGMDSMTGRNVSGGLPVSGESIRALIQGKLKSPFVVYEDTVEGKFRMFSSEYARDKWISGTNPNDPGYDPEGVSGLELFNFDRPSEFVLGQTGLLQEPRYVIKGVEGSTEAELVFGVTLKDGNGQTKGDSIVVTYTITNTLTGVTKSFSEEYGESYVNNDFNKICKNLYEYLGDGQNVVNVNIKGRTVGGNVDVGFGIYLIDFSLSSSFDYSHAKSAGQEITIPFEINRSSVVEGAVLRLTAKVDGVVAKYSSSGADSIWQTGDSSTRIRNSIKIANPYAGGDHSNPHKVYTLSLQAEMSTGSTVFYSNVLYYSFVIGSDEQDLVNQIVTIGTSISNNQVVTSGESHVVLRGKQYEIFRMNWSYYTDQIENAQSVPITFALKRGDDYTVVNTMTGVKGNTSELVFIPEIYTEENEDMYLVALGDEEIERWPIIIDKSNLVLSEAQGYDLKLSAYGMSNSSPVRDVWEDTAHNVQAQFTGVGWDSVSGWSDNSFLTVGTGSYVTIPYCPFPNSFASSGRVIELDFMTEQVNEEDDVLIDIGTSSKGRITVTPNRATLYVNGSEVVSTHFKSNERMKLAFIFNKADANEDSNLVYIVSNGILERAAGAGSGLSYVDATGSIKIGDSPSGVRLYMIRCYPVSLSVQEAYENYVYDSAQKTTILNRNDIMDGGSIVYDKCRNKINTLLIEGNLNKILNKDNNKEDSESTINASFHNVSDSSRDFTLVNGMIRKHGQSTLNYPISSMKIWFNKSADDGINPVLNLGALQTAMRLNKNRYIIKDGAIPSNKFVLQANYADSSGANNGSIMRLIQSCWYDAVIDGEHKLRTSPQLFTSGELVHHDDSYLGETGANVWIDGYGSDTAADKTWADISSKEFPYKIRVAADSAPCAIFYRNTSSNDTSIQFLGQYVFMDDKKSDYLYGERSIYHYYDEGDPFCLKIENKDQDVKANRVWNNNNVVRIEVVLLDNVLTSYMNYNVPKSNDDSVNVGSTVSCDAIKYDNKGNALNFYWEDYFEMIYPDPDDLTIKVNGVKVTEDKFAIDSQFREKADKFLTFLRWITGIGALNAQSEAALGTISTEALNAFKETASQHLDLWKLAAYYIFCLRFGLVDSVERNAQLKTYDGVHWHYEPWDMDIACGNKNDGGFAFDPPVNRNTKLPSDQTKYAFSGRSTSTSNILWDCLESWDYWMDTVVPKVAQALYTAGLSYDNIVALFDDGYSNQWSETMYNESGHYKYVEMRGGDNDWLRWLQGASISHRHWWLSKSMNYYDALWTVGDFNNHRIYIAAEKGIHGTGTDLVTLKPTEDTFFKLTQNDGNSSLGVLRATHDEPAVFDVSAYSFSVKDPTHIYGATFLEELDLSCFAQKLSTLSLGGAYDKELGASLKVLNIGTKRTLGQTGSDGDYSLGAQWQGSVSGTQLNLSGTVTSGTFTGADALGSLITLDVTGQQSLTTTESLLHSNDRKSVQNLYAVGTGLREFINASSGNRFSTLRLPSQTVDTNDNVVSVLGTMTLINASWDNLSFWKSTVSSDVQSHEETDADGNVVVVVEANAATFENVGVGATLTTLVMEGSTASKQCAAELVLDWIAAIRADVASTLGAGATEADIESALLTRLNSYTLHAENIRWGTSDVPVNIYYKDLSHLAAFNQGNNQNANLKGYICIKDAEPLTSVQLSQIREWFGNSVFNKGNINSGLIVDHVTSSEYVRITVGGDVRVENDTIYLNEGGKARLSANKFILSEDNTEYIWTVAAYSSNGDRLSSAPLTLVEGADGIMRLEAGESTLGNYYCLVNAVSNNVQSSVRIDIIGVTYPNDWSWVKTGAGRTLSGSATVMEHLFGNKAYDNLADMNLRDCWLMYTQHQDVELSVAAQGTYTATLRSITYSLSAISSSITTSTIVSSSDELSSGDNTPLSCGVDSTTDREYLYYSKDGHGGMPLHTQTDLPTQMTSWELLATIVIGGTTVRKRINIAVWSDSEAVVNYDAENILYTALRAKTGVNSVLPLYKSDLLSLDGTLTINNATVALVSEPVGNTVSSIFQYLPYLTSVNLQGCTLLSGTSITGADKRVLRLDYLSGLTSVNLSSVTAGSADSIVTLSGSSLSSANFSNSTLGVDVTSGCGVQTLSLGSPSYVHITSPSRLLPAGVSISSTSNLTDVLLSGVNSQQLTGFKVFNALV